MSDLISSDLDADLNASINISHMGVYSPDALYY